MAVKLKSTLQALQSKLQAGGRFKSVSIGEPTDPPDSPHAAIILRRYENTSTTLNGSIERRTVIVRIYQKAFVEPRGDVEFLLDDMVSEFMEDIFGDFDLGGAIRNIEPLGVVVDFGYQSVGRAGGNEVMYRLADVSIPMIVDDNAVFAA